LTTSSTGIILLICDERVEEFFNEKIDEKIISFVDLSSAFVLIYSTIFLATGCIRLISDIFSGFMYVDIDTFLKTFTFISR
jgi:hypothetical protein